MPKLLCASVSLFWRYQDCHEDKIIKCIWCTLKSAGDRSHGWGQDWDQAAQRWRVQEPLACCLLLVLLSALQPLGVGTQPLLPLFALPLYIRPKHPEESQGFFLGGMTYTQGKLGATSASSQVCHLSCHQPYLGSLCPCQVCPIETLGALVFLSMM